MKYKILKMIHFEQFKNCKEEERLRNIHDFEDANHTIRNDQSISGCMKTAQILETIEKKIIGLQVT